MRIPSTSPDRFAWIGIIPVEIAKAVDKPWLKRELAGQIAPGSPYVFRIIRFEVFRKTIENNWDVAYEYLNTMKSEAVSSVEAIEEALRRYGCNDDDLTDPVQCEYPI